MKPFLRIVLLTLAIGGCKKKEVDALPKATQSGQNTFGGLVDGKTFVPLPPQGINFSKREPLEASIYRTDQLVSASGNGFVDFALRNASQLGTCLLGGGRTSSYASHHNKRRRLYYRCYPHG